ncbi:MAG: flavodoxin family protein [Bacteroidota bacterium]
MHSRILISFIFVLVVVAVARAQQGTATSTILIVYHSEEGHTRQMADAVYRGVKSVAGIDAQLRSVSEADSSDVRSADAIIVGSPVYNAAVAPQIQEFINSWPFDGSMRNKIGAAFTTGGGISAGEELVQVGILHSMLVFGMIIVGGEQWTSAFGASAVTSEDPFKKGRIDRVFLEKGEALGKRVAELTVKLRRH